MLSGIGRAVSRILKTVTKQPLGYIATLILLACERFWHGPDNTCG
jgi:hypothetical protein